MNKDMIINSYSKNEFMNFLRLDKDGNILNLFDEEGINIIINSNYREERIAYILTYSPYKNELFNNINFLDMFLNTNITYFYANLHNLNSNTYDKILNRCIELNKDPKTFAYLFSYFDTDYKLNKLDNWNYSKELLYYILKMDKEDIVQKIINNYDIDLLSNNIDLESFFSNAKESVLKAQAKRNKDNTIISYISVPIHMITNKMGEKIWNKYDIFSARAIINDAQYSTDASVLNDYIKFKEDELLINYDDSKLLSPFQELFDTFKKYKLKENSNDDDCYKYSEEFIRLINKIDNVNFYKKFNKIYEENGFEGIKQYLEQLNNNCLSNYIIDYLFEENYHNIMLDIRELLNFYFKGNIVIPEERVEIYNQLSNIDYLEPKDKIELYKYLKQFNMIETFYDDMAMARYIVAENIKEYSLSSQTIRKFKDEKLSKEYGVDVYNLNGNNFFGIVKTGTPLSDSLPAGHSYSLIGDGGIAIFGDPKDSNTFLYDSDDMNPKQLIHAFPFDSYTYYHPFEYSNKPTTRVNTLITPEELVSASLSYNEILVLEKGINKTDIDDSIPKLKKIALYCLDEIRKQDIIAAKQNDVGIVLIDSSKYKKTINNPFSKFHRDIEHFEYNYFNGSYEKEKFEARR